MAESAVGSVFIRVRPDADGFRRDAQNQIRRQGPIQAEGEVDLDRTQAERERQAVQRHYDRNPLEVPAEVDLDRRLRDAERFQGNLMETIRRTQGEMDGLNRRVGELQRNLSNMEVGVSQEDLSRLRREVRDIRARLRIDTDEAREDIDTLDADIDVALETGGAYRDFYKFKADMEAQGISVDLNAHPDVSSAVRAALSARTAANAAMTPIPLRTRLNRSSVFQAITQAQTMASTARPTVNMRVRLQGLARVEAALLRASRDRVIRMRTSFLYDRVWQNLRGGFRSLAGLSDMDEMLHAFDSIIRRLDVMGTQAALMGTAIGSAVAVAGHALGGLIVTLADVSRAFGLAAAGPTAMLAAWAAFQVHRGVWSEFTDALRGNEEALAALPENAQRAVSALQELNDVVYESIRQNYWGQIGERMRIFAETITPVLERGMGRAAQIYGDSMAQMLDLAQHFAETGQVGAAFTNINRMFEGFGQGAISAFDAFMTLGLRAARLFPRLGFEFEQMMSAFNQWIQWSSDTGRIDLWIINAVETLRELGTAAGAAGGMMQGLVRAFRRAGIEGLPALVRGLESARDLMQSPVWQFRMGNMFEGMAIGARNVWEGVREIASALYDSHHWARQLFIVIGEVAREFGTRIGEIIRNPIFQQGGLDLFSGVRDALETLRPGAEYLANILGSLGSIAGEIIREMAPGINTLMGIFSDALGHMLPSILRVIDPLTQFIDNLGHSVRRNVNIIAPALASLLNIFASLPAPLQNFITLAAVMSRWMPAFGTWFANAARNLVGFGSAADRTYSRARRLINIFGTGGARNIQRAGQHFRAAGQAMVFMGSSAATARGRMAGFAAMVTSLGRGGLQAVAGGARAAGRALGSMVSLLGGIPGLALMGVITAIGMVNQKAAEAEQQIRAMTDALMAGDEQGVRFSIAENLESELTKIQDLGGDVAQIVDQLATGDGSRQMISDWQTINTEVAAYEGLLQQGLGGMHELSDGAREALQRQGVSWEDVRNIGGRAISQITKGLEEQADRVSQSERSFRLQSEAMRENEGQIARTTSEARALQEQLKEQGETLHYASQGALDFANAIATVGDDSNTIESRIAGMSQALMMLSDDYSSSAEIAVESWNRTQQAMETANAITEATGQINGDVAEGIATDWETMNERRALALQGADELHEVAMARAIQAYDEAIDAGHSHAEAIEAGKSAYQSISPEIDQFIEKAGMSSDEADAFREHMESLQDVSDIEAVLTLTNLSEDEISMAYDGLVAIKEAGVDIDGAEWMAFIAANPEQALLAVANTAVALANFEAYEYIATLGATEQDALEAAANAIGAGQEWDEGNYAAIFTALTEGEEDVDDLVDKIWEWDGERAEAIFGSKDEATEVLNELLPKVEEFEGERTAEFVENGGSELVETLDQLNYLLAEIARHWGIDIEYSDDEAQAALDLLLETLGFVDETEAEATADVNTAPMAGGMAVAHGLAEQLDGTVSLTHADTEYSGVQSGVQAATGLLSGFAEGLWQASLSARWEGVLQPIQTATGALSSFAEGLWETALSADSGGVNAGVDSARGSINSGLVSPSWQAFLDGDPSGAVGAASDAAAAVLSRLTGRQWMTNLQGNPQPVINAATQATARLRSVPTQTLSRLMGNARNAISAATSATRSIGSVPNSKTSWLSATGNAISVAAQARRQILAIPNRTVRIRAVATGVGAAAAAIRNAARAAFADGGFMPPVHQYMAGGFENHTAQIAGAGTPMRVWNEPETGGEAYIPLAASKRARSIAIWQETGRRLGVEPEREIVQGDSGQRGPTVNLTVNHPQAERPSRTVQRSLSYLSAGGGFDD